jgi:hypothetical protein
MTVSKEDREEYERGQRDRDLGVFDRAVNDITGQHPDSEAYNKGRQGEQFDDDKED